MTAKSDQQRIIELRRQIRHHDWLYYVQAAPEISDRRYDALVEELRAWRPATRNWSRLTLRPSAWGESPWKASRM